MQFRRLGSSGLEVSRLGLGTMGFGVAGDEDERQLRAFLDAGGTLVDTAPIYGDGRSERSLGALLGDLGVRDDVVLASKCAVAVRRGELVADASRRTMLQQLDESLRALGTDHLDLWQLHGWDETTPVDETLSALEHAVSSGRVRYVGISNFTGWQTALAQTRVTARPAGLSFVSTQMQYSLLNRAIEDEVVPAATHVGLGLLAWSPLARGVLTGKYRLGTPADSRAANPTLSPYMDPYLDADSTAIVDAVIRAAEGLDVAPAHVALAWLRDRPAVGSMLVGARTADQLTVSLASEDVELPQEIVQALDDVSSPDGWQD
ncbi:aldo/keto reductase [Aeromicrobium sp. CTD01-1L150]|uniref:aldo/keto reductase n=1 Tax=Aeromicrobium sp. CTD01-1L150 TaxID=3341830 RepID=UPI0035BFA5C0